MRKWKVKNEIILFPQEWDKSKILQFINAEYIRKCFICGKIDIPYDHFNNCNPAEQAAITANRDMAGY